MKKNTFGSEIKSQGPLLLQSWEISKEKRNKKSGELAVGKILRERTFIKIIFKVNTCLFLCRQFCFRNFIHFIFFFHHFFKNHSFGNKLGFNHKDNNKKSGSLKESSTKLSYNVWSKFSILMAFGSFVGFINFHIIAVEENFPT